MTSRERFLAACFPHKVAKPLGRPPLWIMRQAGRYLPEYRAVKERFSFLEMVRTPEIAAEVTLQPLRRFPALDAAILFSDILVIPEALGQPYSFRDSGGIQMPRRLASRADIDALAPADAVPEKLSYVAAALRLLKRELSPAPAPASVAQTAKSADEAQPRPIPQSAIHIRHSEIRNPQSAIRNPQSAQSAIRNPQSERALLGFGGSPWTLAAYMLEGGSSDDFARAREFFHADRAAFGALMEKLTAALVAYFKMQIAAGADAIQIFDSWGGILAARDYEEASLRWIREIAAALPADFPVILYSKGTAAQHAAQAASGVRVLSVDWTVDLAALRRELPAEIALQGNLDPAFMETTPEIVRREALRLLEAMRGATASPSRFTVHGSQFTVHGSQFTVHGAKPVASLETRFTVGAAAPCAGGAAGGHIFNLGHGITPRAKIECVQALADAVTGFGE